VALTVRPDDEVYQFDTVWLGPDEYTLPIQARYVAWGTWLACFLLAAAVLIPLGGQSPGGVLGSVMWAIAVSVVAARAVMLVVDHERPLRSLPRLLGAEARAALDATRQGERPQLLRAGRLRVRDMPAKVHEIRARQRRAAERRAQRAGSTHRSTRLAGRKRHHEPAEPPEATAERAASPPSPAPPYGWESDVGTYEDWGGADHEEPAEPATVRPEWALPVTGDWATWPPADATGTPDDRDFPTPAAGAIPPPAAGAIPPPAAGAIPPPAAGAIPTSAAGAILPPAAGAIPPLAAEAAPPLPAEMRIVMPTRTVR
jgi:hypothetical protein